MTAVLEITGGLLLFFFLITIFSSQLSWFAFGVGVINGGVSSIFNLFRYTGASCDTISVMLSIIGSILFFLFVYKIYHVFKGS